MLHLRSTFLATVTLFALGCSSTVITASDDAGAADPDTGATVDLGATPDSGSYADGPGRTSCLLPNGRVCQVGQACPAGDGCNTCSCYGGMEYAACTVIGCAVDASTPRDVPVACRLPNGGICPGGQSCPAGDGCNDCYCDGATGQAMCTARPCAIDAGPAGCLSSSDCGSGRVCNFTAPGCGVPGTCGFVSDCAAIVQYCGCSGETFMDCPGVANQPWMYRGACGSDAGAPSPDAAVCSGAGIGPGGGYCAGPADGPLPVSCCTNWNCDVRLSPCDSLPPTCPSGQAATVSSLACWGPCVPAANCAPMRCGDGCPTGWSCDATSGNCRRNG